MGPQIKLLSWFKIEFSASIGSPFGMYPGILTLKVESDLFLLLSRFIYRFIVFVA